MVAPGLARLSESLPNNPTPAFMSYLLTSTYTLLCSAACTTNRTIELGKTKVTKSKPNHVLNKLQKRVLRAHKAFVGLSSYPSSPEQLATAREALTQARGEYRRCVRSQQCASSFERDSKLNSILSKNPADIFRSIKSSKASLSTKISSIRVGSDIYEGASVPDGFFDSMSRLKCPDMDQIKSTPEFKATYSDYENIIQICQSGAPIKPISTEESVDILYSIRADVNDFFSITANHFIHAGLAGLKHFHYLISTIINNVNLSSLNELNTAWACIIYKGHKKDHDSDRSYRNISCCPFISKAVDVYVGRLNSPGWSACQAATQFQGEGSSHDLAALLLTETVQYSLHSNHKTVYVLLLDAQSAFDKIVRECAMKSAFLAGTCDQSLLHLNSRLASRLTFPEWDKVLMGPIRDSLGLEQGGVNSDKLYKLCNNNQLSAAQLSQLGVDCGADIVSSIGLADDTALVSDSIHKLANLVYLTEQYCSSYHVTLVPEKTKLLAFIPPCDQHSALYSKLINPITLAGRPINFCDSAEHVGILRTVEGGNMPHIMSRISAHRRAVKGILHCGIAKYHRANPAAGLRLERIYGAPVLLSGVAPLVLSNSELNTLHSHYKNVIRQILKLPENTPESFIFFSAGTLPIIALIHLDILTLLGMLGRLGSDNILNRIGCHSLLTHANPESWFLAARYVTQLYGLCDPLLALQQPLPKSRWKSLCRSRVIRHWEVQYRAETEALESLLFFRANFFSLARPHRILTSAGSPYEVEKSLTVLRMLSGRYVTDHRARHWMPGSTGACRLCPASPQGPAPKGDLAHQLLFCVSLAPARTRVLELWEAHMAPRPHLLPLVSHYTLEASVELHLPFLLDPTSLPLVITAAENHGEVLYGDLLYMSRSWCHSIHNMRMNLLNVFGIL